jgi:Mg-chelatase subunit ChlD
VVWIVARRGHRVVGERQLRAATVVRSIGVGLLVLALSLPLLVLGSKSRSVVILLDRSASITSAAHDLQDEYLVAAVAAAGPEDATAVAVFGRDVRLDRALTTEPDSGPVRTVIDASATDLGGALRAAAAVLPTEGSRRIVVLTDGVETMGSARIAATELREAGVAVDFVNVETGLGSDVIVLGVDAPVTARVGDDVPVTVRFRSTISGSGTVAISAGEDQIEVPVDLVPGTKQVDVALPADAAGVLRIRTVLDIPGDAVPENDGGEALVRVLGPAKVGVVAGKIGEGDDLVRALAAGGIDADPLTAVPAAAELLGYDAMLLVNVPAPGEDIAADLAAFVEDLGRGLVVIGGDQAFGLGDYQNTVLEDLLPVTSDPEDFIRRQPVAEVLVIDTSGSMAACHCDDTTRRNDFDTGGINKTDISRAGAGLAIGALQPTDRVGVLAFTSGTRWALPLAEKPSGDVVAAALATLTPQGDTEISVALREALDVLRDAPEEIRHIVLFTDGWGDDADLLTVAQDIAAEGITLSVLGTGEGTGETLRRMASLGGGQFYPGRDLQSVPEVFVEETLRVARPLVAEGSFVPALGAASQVTAGLTATPPLRGYVLTTAKPTATIPLEIGPGDPLLATWQRGLGRATTWASDATTRWSADWVTWDGFVDFWGRVVGDVLPAGRDAPPAVRLDGGSLAISYETAAPLDAVAIAQVRDGDGQVTSVPMQRTGEDSFAVQVPVAAEGAHWVAVRVEGPDGLIASGSSGIVAGYPDEFAFREPDPELAADVTEATGGRIEPAPEDLYASAATRGAAEQDLWPWLVGGALALFLADVALRRLVIARGDLRRWREALIPRREPVAALETPAEGDAGEPPSREALPEEETIGRLLRRKRG